MMRPRGFSAQLVGAAALAAALLVPAAAIAPAASAADATEQAIVSADITTQSGGVEKGVPRNYAVNLALEASDAQFADLVTRAEGLGGVVLEKYPQLRSFFVQASSGDFAGKLNNAAAGVGIPVTSIGPTRQAPVSGAEIVVADADQSAIARARLGASALESQLDEADSAAPDPFTGWDQVAIGAVEAQSVDVPLEKAVVGVLDSGVDGTHEDLVGQIDEALSVGCQRNGVPDTSWNAWQDDNGHGTHVAGTIAAAHNGIGIDGVAPTNVTIAAVKVSNVNGLFYPEYTVCGFVWAADHGFDVTNNSYYVDPWMYWLPTEPTQAAGLEVVTRAVEHAHGKGVVNVAAAGNADHDNDNPTLDSSSPNDMGSAGAIKDRNVEGGVDIPTMIPSVVSTSAVQPAEWKPPYDNAPLVRASFSNYGAKNVDIAAPGRRVASTYPKAVAQAQGLPTPYAALSGTSMAAPHVAGVAALIKGIHPNATADQVIEVLKKHAAEHYDRLQPSETNGVFKEYRGAGLVNALSAVLKDQPKPTIGTVEYSTDGKTWAPLEGASVPTTISIRVGLTGPVTAATLDVDGLATAEAQASGAFDGSVELKAASVDLSTRAAQTSGDGVRAAGPAVTVKVSAQGRNKDARADDDVSASVAFTVRTAPTPTPNDPSKPTPADPGKPAPADPTKPSPSAPGSDVVTVSAESAQAGDLARTGAPLTNVLLGAFALVVIGGVAVLFASRRIRRSQD
ncbi:S8 family serine peptidase [Schaalia sp. 19OD2882]|uniref:S8 family serine peptidase n=1 Tax=Schaalia sp. 19OD2882 TaxID=2794089 RepID=UPI001C1EE757|nr:S8 family serine peptidase [Schaalia sp. 19OD2882]QWW20344.1 S8 family serine peptidase [Schaalia sp. 19OD2882]